MTESPAEPQAQLSHLTRAQRRVLGVLIEKGITTPEVYPLTVKALVSGCNQKSNRDPVTSYDEDKVEQVLDELREMGLAAVVHTESGRTARYRHYMRHKFTFTEPQLAILTELMLRGRQSVGELRTRASRMAPIDSLEQLRNELNVLLEKKLIQSDGALDRRGAEVDHALYPPGEKPAARPAPSPSAGMDSSSRDDREEPARPASHSAPQVSSAPSPGLEGRVAALERNQEQLRAAQESLEDTLRDIRHQFESLSNAFDDLRRSLGG